MPCAVDGNGGTDELEALFVSTASAGVAKSEEESTDAPSNAAVSAVRHDIDGRWGPLRVGGTTALSTRLSRRGRRLRLGTYWSGPVASDISPHSFLDALAVELVHSQGTSYSTRGPLASI